MLKSHLSARVKWIDYRNFQYHPQKYYLRRWVELYLPQTRFTMKRDQTNWRYFVNGDLPRVVIEQEQKSNTLARTDRTARVLISKLSPRISKLSPRTSSLATCGSRRIQCESGLRRCTQIQRIIPGSRGCDGQPASPTCPEST
jgi:hypothetical protein